MGKRLCSVLGPPVLVMGAVTVPIPLTAQVLSTVGPPVAPPS